MTVRRKAAGAAVLITLAGGLVLPSAAHAEPAPQPDAASKQARDICPPPSRPGDPGSESSNPVGTIQSVSITGTAAARVAHVTVAGFDASSYVDFASWQAFCAGDPGATGQARVPATGPLTVDIPIVAGVSNFIHLDHSSSGGGTLAFFVDDSGDDDGSTAPTSVGTPLLASTTITGTTTRTAHFRLTGGNEGDTLLVTDYENSVSGTAFAADGTLEVDFPVKAGGITDVEFHVFPKPGQGSTPFVFETAVNDTADPTYGFRVSAITFTDSPRTAHVTIDGLLPKTPVTLGGASAPVTAMSDTTGRATLAVELGQRNLFDITHQTPTGTAAFALQLDPNQKSTPEPGDPVTPPTRPRPQVTLTPGIPGTTVVTVHDRPANRTELVDTNGHVFASVRADDSGEARIIVSTPAQAKPIFVTTTFLGAIRATSTTLSEGVGSDRPAAPSVRELGKSTRGTVLEVRGEAGSILRISDSTGAVIPSAKAIGSSGVTQIVMPTPTTATTVEVRLDRGGRYSAPTTQPVGP